MEKYGSCRRLEAFAAEIAKQRLDAAVVFGEANVKAFTGVDCDNACLLVPAAAGGGMPRVVFYTDFRYAPAVERSAPWLETDDIAKLSGRKPFGRRGLSLKRIGYESSVSKAKFDSFRKIFPGARFKDVLKSISLLRAVKTQEEIARLRAAESLNDEIWSEAKESFKAGMTEKDMARTIKHLMIERGDGESFDTIVCVGKNAAECHHVPDSTVWDGREPVLVDMGVKLDGYCSDMTRNIVPARPSRLYAKVYDLVLKANELGIASAKPGITCKRLDGIVRRFLSKNGFGKAFGHSLGHGVGVEVHEAPAVSKRSDTVLKPGMAVTIEPGVYLPGNLGVRIEDLVVVTETGCEVLSRSDKQKPF